MKKTILALSLLMLASSAAAAMDPAKLAVLDDRRTAFVPFGQKVLVFEAPTNMCFFDETNPAQAAMLGAMKAHAAKKGKTVLMAVFADCLEMSSLSEADANDPVALPDIGTISWMNPYIGETAALPENDYFDMRETSMPQYMTESLKAYPDVTVDQEPQRTTNGVSLAYTSNIEIEYQKYTITGISSAMLVQGYPVDITLTHTSRSPITQKARLYTVMDKVMAQNVTLNRVR